MTDSELNEAVALKLGDCLVGCKHSPLPYCTQISAAWEIVEHLFKLEWAMELKSYPVGGEWSCWLNQQGEKIILADADTAPRAICEAFLKLP